MSRKAAKTDNLVDPELRKLFLVHVDAYTKQKAKVDKASTDMRTLTNTIKGDGFSMMQIKDAIWLATPEGEAEFKAEIANRMLAAAYVGADIGEQLSLFLDHDRTPLIDRAYKEGQACAMENKAAVPKYDPSTEAYKFFMQGYHDEQGRQVKTGIGKLDAKAGNGKGASASPKSGKKKGAKAAAKGAKPAGRRGRPPGSGKGAAPKDDAPPRRPAAAPATRASVAAAKAKGGDDPASYFSKSTEPKGTA